MNTNKNNNATTTTANSVFANSRMGRTGSRNCNCIGNNCNCTIPAFPVPVAKPNMLLEMYISCDNCEERISIRDFKKVGSYKVCEDCATEVEECDFCCELVSEYETDAGGYIACDNCRDYNISMCDECGFFFDSDYEGAWIDSEEIYVCNNCLDANFRSCDSCNTYSREEYMNTDDNGNCFCSDCYERSYARCSCCYNVFRFDDLIYDECSGEDYCSECYEQEKNKIHKYGYKPAPIFHGSGNRYFGVELEIADGGEDNDNALKILESVDSESGNKIYIKHDGSLHGKGFEIVSHPMTLDYHMNEMDWEILMEAADNLGYTSQDNDECGLHVHVSRDSFSSDYVIGNCIVFVDKFFEEEIMSITRRTEEQIDEWAKKYDVYSFEGVDVNNEKEVYKECYRKNQKDRYYCINLRNRNTVEFRIFKGTLNYKTFISTIEFVDSVVEFAEYIFSESLNMNDMEWEDYVSFVKKEEKYKELLDFLNSKGLCNSTKIEKSKEFKIRNNTLVKYLGKDANVIIPDGVTSIGDEAFEHCTSLTNVTISNSVVSIGRYAFSGCTSLKNITIPNSVASIGDFTFRGCTSLTNITIPNSVTRIESFAFSGCESLTSVTIPDSVTSIGESAFSNCESLTSITIPDSVTSIGSWAFAYCISLTNVTIPDGVITIENYTFSGCNSLTNVTIPDSVTCIGRSAFERCTSLTNVTIPDSVAYIGKCAFENCGLISQLANAI